MNTKLKKVFKDIEKYERIYQETQEKLKVLNREKEDLENLAMVDFLKKHKIHHSELKTIVDILHSEKGKIIPLKNEFMEGDKIEYTKEK